GAVRSGAGEPAAAGDGARRARSRPGSRSADVRLGEHELLPRILHSGTTGRRGVFPQTPAEFAQWLKAAWRVWARIGLRRGARTIGVGGPTPLHITQKLF